MTVSRALRRNNMRTRPAGGGRGAKHANAQMQGPPDPGKSMTRVTVYKAVGNGKPCLEQGKAVMVSAQHYRASHAARAASIHKLLCTPSRTHTLLTDRNAGTGRSPTRGQSFSWLQRAR